MSEISKLCESRLVRIRLNSNHLRGPTDRPPLRRLSPPTVQKQNQNTKKKAEADGRSRYKRQKPKQRGQESKSLCCCCYFASFPTVLHLGGRPPFVLSSSRTTTTSTKMTSHGNDTCCMCCGIRMRGLTLLVIVCVGLVFATASVAFPWYLFEMCEKQNSMLIFSPFVGCRYFIYDESEAVTQTKFFGMF